jgi:hypothetical protein
VVGDQSKVRPGYQSYPGPSGVKSKRFQRGSMVSPWRELFARIWRLVEEFGAPEVANDVAVAAEDVP